ncbi:MAG: STAS domain-containing protein [Pseudomonadota bacterium]
MNFDTEMHGTITVVKLTDDRLDASMAIRFKEALKTLVDDGVDHMLLDMGNIDFMDSSGLGAVVAHMKYMGTERVFEICGLTPTVDKVFKLTRMDSVFKIYPDAQSALDADARKAS